MSTLFRKTAKGQAEMTQRSRELTPRLRGTLILVDGRRDLAAISALLARPADEALAALLEQGFVEPVMLAEPPESTQRHDRQENPRFAESAPAPLQDTSAAAPQAAALTRVGQVGQVRQVSREDAATLRRQAVSNLIQSLGPAGETLAMRMERARTLEELRPLLALAAQTVASARGQAAGAAYAAQFQSLMWARDSDF
jgi:hypothetical protein